MRKKLLTVALAATMVVSSVATAFAAEAEDTFEVLKSYDSIIGGNGPDGQLIEAISSISETTGFSVSFNFENAIDGVTETDWRSSLVSADWNYQMGSFLLTCTTDGWTTRTNIFPHQATLTSAGQAKVDAGTQPYQLFFNTTDKITVSYNPDKSISLYLAGEKLFTYEATVAGDGAGKTVADFWEAMVKSASESGLRFAVNVKNVKVGYSVGYVSPSQGGSTTGGSTTGGSTTGGDTTGGSTTGGSTTGGSTTGGSTTGGSTTGGSTTGGSTTGGSTTTPTTGDYANVVALLAVAAVAGTVVVLRKKTVTE